MSYVGIQLSARHTDAICGNDASFSNLTSIIGRNNYEIQNKNSLENSITSFPIFNCIFLIFQIKKMIF